MMMMEFEIYYNAVMKTMEERMEEEQEASREQMREEGYGPKIWMTTDSAGNEIVDPLRMKMDAWLQKNDPARFEAMYS